MNRYSEQCRRSQALESILFNISKQYNINVGSLQLNNLPGSSECILFQLTIDKEFKPSAILQEKLNNKIINSVTIIKPYLKRR